MYRNKKILEVSKDIECCTGCGKYNIGDVVAAHSNWSEHGKGLSIKAHDCFIAYLCQSCHDYVDKSSASKEEKKEFWTKAHDLSMLWLFRNKVKF